MIHDPKLVEAVELGIARWGVGLSREQLRACAYGALDSIYNSGIAWVAPWEITDTMSWAAGAIGEHDRYARMRDAYRSEEIEHGPRSKAG